MRTYRHYLCAQSKINEMARLQYRSTPIEADIARHVEYGQHRRPNIA